MGIYRINGAVQNYDWGGKTFMQDLFGLAEKQVVAEYWLGAHPRGMGLIQTSNGPVTLQSHLTNRGEDMPFLFKVLDVQAMLSIQCHPTKEQARIGFHQENEKQIALDAFERNFKDDNEKAEAMYALSEFYLLHGFRSTQSIHEHFNAYDALKELVEDQPSNKLLLERILTLPTQDSNRILSALEKAVKGRNWDKMNHEYWVSKAIEKYSNNGNYTNSVLTIFLLNLVKMEPGQVIFQEPNLIHAYLSGQCVEIMSNSDNVFRAGLTSKLIDVPVLLEHSSFDTKEVKFTEDSDGVYTFPNDAFAFEHVQKSRNYHSSTNEIFLVLGGSMKILYGEQSILLRKGQAAYIDPQTDYKIEIMEKGSIFRAFAQSAD